MESAKYCTPSKKRCKQFNLTLKNAFAALSVTFNKECKTMSIEKLNVSPAVCSLLQGSQPTSASIERSFSMMRKLLAEDRKFEVEDINEYMILHFHSCIW